MYGNINFPQSDFELDLKSLLTLVGTLLDKHQRHQKALSQSFILFQSIFATAFQQSLPSSDANIKKIGLAVTSSTSSKVLDEGSSHLAPSQGFALFFYLTTSSLRAHYSSFAGTVAIPKSTIRKLDFHCRVKIRLLLSIVRVSILSPLTREM